ncbi:MAG TPA: DinB family protein [Gemmatimonadaceae bacterium]|nr:DinB family protein [Gemmatimonadaceae bacterium]
MRTTLVVLLLLAAALPAAAQAPGAPATGFRGEFIANFRTVQDKYLALANAIPQDKYTWRPGTGVRSVAEALLHVASAQYLYGAPLGVKAPPGFDPKSFEISTTDKSTIIAALRAAFAAMDAAVLALPAASADNPVKFFGQTYTTRSLLLMETDHNAEHLGQLIAYARVNGVVPPWSMGGS